MIDLPEDERARFAEERKAGEMALRKLQEEVRQEKEKVTAVKELANRNAAEAEAKFADELKQKDTQMAKLTAEKAKVAAQIEVLEKRAAEAEKSNQKRQKEAIGIALEEERKKLDAAAEKQSELLKQIDELNGQRDRQVAEARRKAEEEMNAKMYGDGNATKLVRDTTGMVDQVTSGLKDATGIDLTELLSSFHQPFQPREDNE